MTEVKKYFKMVSFRVIAEVGQTSAMVTVKTVEKETEGTATSDTILNAMWMALRKALDHFYCFNHVQPLYYHANLSDKKYVVSIVFADAANTWTVQRVHNNEIGAMAQCLQDGLCMAIEKLSLEAQGDE